MRWSGLPSVLLLNLLHSLLKSHVVVEGLNLCQPCANGGTLDEDDECSTTALRAARLITGSSQCDAVQLELYQNGCCSEAPLSVCNLCPHNGRASKATVVPNFDPSGEDLTCADLPSDEYFLDYMFEAGTCDDTMLQRSAAWCGCTGVQRECTLCPNGERPPNLALVDPVYYGWDCDTFDYVSSFFSEEECSSLVDSIFEFDAPSFCGCTDAPIPNVCNLCPDGEILYNPDFSLGDFTCRELALSTRYIPDEDPCSRVLASHKEDGYIKACCAAIDVVPIRLGGTSTTETSASNQWAVVSTTLLLWVVAFVWTGFL